MLEVRGLTALWFRGQPLQGYGDARSIKFDARAGDWVFIAGENGVGKTTLLHALAGTVRYSTGDIRLGDERLEHQNPASRFSCGVSFIPQHSFVCGKLYWEDAVDLIRLFRPAMHNELAIEDLRRRLSEHRVLKEGETLDPRIFELLCSVLSVPRVLLLDEIGPSWPGPLDKLQAYRLLRELLPETIVIFTEHETEVALEATDYALWLKSDAQARPEFFSVADETLLGKLLDRLGQRVRIEDPELSDEVDERWQVVMRLDRSPRSQLQVALLSCKGRIAKSAAGLAEVRAKILEDFPFLDSRLPAERLSGGQRTVLRWFLLEFTGLGELPAELVGHLDARNRELIGYWSGRVKEWL